MPTAGKKKVFQNEPDKNVVEVHVKSAEPREELRSRLRQQEAEAEHQRHKDKIILLTVVSVVSVVSLVCV